MRVGGRDCSDDESECNEKDEMNNNRMGVIVEMMETLKRKVYSQI